MTNSLRPIGLDFGTTNSALAFADDHAARGARLSEFRTSTVATNAQRSSTFRSVLFFEAPDRGPRPDALAGPLALERYRDTGGNGRLLLSLKSFLSSTLFKSTDVYGKTFTLEELVAVLLRRLREQVEEQHGPIGKRVVLGRPVRFVGDEGDVPSELPLSRLRAAAALADFTDIEFEYEPVAAAKHYESSLDHDELVLVGDFGGGTSDFCLMHLGPSRNAKILGTEGVGLAGDSFDGEIIRHVIAPALGAGGEYRSYMEQRLIPIPPWPYERLRKWHHLSFLKSYDTMRFLKDLRAQALEPQKIEALIHIVEDDLGPELFQSVEGSKQRLSKEQRVQLLFSQPPTVIDAAVERALFELWITVQLQAIERCVDNVLAHTNIDPREVNRVFLTGGSALVPAVRAIFARRFGEEKLTGGDELTSVATGLALCAKERW